MADSKDTMMSRADIEIRIMGLLQDMDDLGCPGEWRVVVEAAEREIKRLRAEVETWVGKTRTAIWSDSEECRLLAADNERLRAALRETLEIAMRNEDGDYVARARAALDALIEEDGKLIFETPTASAAENTDDR